MNSFNRDFNRTRNFVRVFITCVALLIVGGFLVTGGIVVYAIFNAGNIAHTAGELAAQAKAGYEGR